MSWFLALAAGGSPLEPIAHVYKEFLSTGIVGAIALLFFFIWRAAVKHYRQVVKDKDAAYLALQESYRKHLESLGKQYHDELRGLTRDMGKTLEQSSISQTKNTEVLRQVVEVQDSVERTLDRMADRFGYDTRGSLRKGRTPRGSL